MSDNPLAGVFDELETPFLADACVRQELHLRAIGGAIEE